LVVDLTAIDRLAKRRARGSDGDALTDNERKRRQRKRDSELSSAHIKGRARKIGLKRARFALARLSSDESVNNNNNNDDDVNTRQQDRAVLKQSVRLVASVLY
jgi:hypothetical protein